ncbi:hypothetical protein VOLCADRAFT_121013 [Volvox carteri f. nagariensis]|uniref:Bidirectional sugar transporter SWEET n=1 Tax=Volvox carteri f. nagariensis TaxID=3068 RepID=D8TZF0_VOLCA|nr:uncharacterized protein VOLCADRAFT_121013 [Volvox carteri f. nagariensis]EFJ47168.1 hypothetical protein VOLCADRAFT_121013 [Volvox carteri f. nagariensis]|eukprot:XP_002951717.1 hypothetical protein VOLCADRAFT_121013 [Volvox carteri f. nagariensis]
MGAFTETAVPIFGNILATAMLLSPFPAVLRLRQTGKLMDINPLPYPMTCINAAGWVAYGYAVANPYIFPANIIGFLAGMFFTLTAFSCAPQKLQDLITGLLVAGSGYFIMLGLISCFGLAQTESQRMWGISAVAILMCYYFVPLSTMVSIVRTRNAASIYPPLAATAIANGSMWTIYGLAVKDINLWLPNMFGAVIGAVQLILRLVYGARSVGDAPAVTVADEEAFVVVHKGAGAPVEDRMDSGTNLLRPGHVRSSGQGATGPTGPGGAAEPTANSGATSRHWSDDASAASPASPSDPGQSGTAQPAGGPLTAAP